VLIVLDQLANLKQYTSISQQRPGNLCSVNKVFNGDCQKSECFLYCGLRNLFSLVTRLDWNAPGS